MKKYFIELVLMYKCGQMENDLESLKKKFDLLTLSRYRDRSKIEDAVKVQDRLREKSGDWNGVEEIRRWREKR